MFGLTQASVNIGEDFFRTIATFYLIYGLSMSIKGYLEGTADMLFSGIVGISGLGIRLMCSYIVKDVFGNMVVAYAEAFSWIFLLVVFTLRYLNKTKKEHLTD